MYFIPKEKTFTPALKIIFDYTIIYYYYYYFFFRK